MLLKYGETCEICGKKFDGVGYKCPSCQEAFDKKEMVLWLKQFRVEPIYITPIGDSFDANPAVAEKDDIAMINRRIDKILEYLYKKEQSKGETTFG